jgi:hypothetical protein
MSCSMLSVQSLPLLPSGPAGDVDPCLLLLANPL